MPRELKTVPKAVPVAKKPKKKNGYEMPESIPLGEILQDLSKNQWKIGPSIGVGGFGEIYTACDAKKTTKKADDYNYVVKIEPHGNGPLFVEMHFYMRNAKLEDINSFMQTHSLKSLGMPYLLGSGSHELNEKKHRFIVMPRYGKDIWSIYLANDKKLPEHTIYRLAIQMLDVYEYIHGCTYVHADLKGANILLGCNKKGSSQAYLVDFGLASHYTTKNFKPDPKKMHNGTIEYTSRDAHSGVPTMRGDLEILGYNLLHWTSSSLPWETDKLLTNPGKVHKAKEEFMAKLDISLKKYYKNSISDPIQKYLKYVAGLKYDEIPNYNKCREMFLAGLKVLSKTNTGDLEFNLASAKKLITSKTSKARSPNKRIKSPNSGLPIDSEDSDNDDVFQSPREKRYSSRSPIKRKLIDDGKSRRSKILKTTPITNEKKIPDDETQSNFSPIVNIKKMFGSSAKKKPGKTIINDNLTPNTSSKNTYEFNFELDVSVDADVIVNVKRKKKPVNKEDEANGISPKPKVRVRRLPKEK